MGFFSWKTNDTTKSINNHYTGIPTFRVIMTDNKGNQWVEDNYEGYGIFGGKDYHELLDEMNGGSGDRLIGIARMYDKKYKNQIFPSLSENGDYHNGIQPEDCEYQGYFYDAVCQECFDDIDNIDELKDKLFENEK